MLIIPYKLEKMCLSKINLIILIFRFVAYFMVYVCVCIIIIFNIVPILKDVVIINW